MYYIWKVTDEYPDSYWFKFDKELVDYLMFEEGIFIEKLQNIPIYKINRKISKDKITKFDYLLSDGPILISPKFVEVIKRLALNDVQLFDCEVFIKEEKLEGYKILNIVKIIDCIDFEKSEKRYFIKNEPEKGFSIKRHVFIEKDLENIMLARPKGSEIGMIIVSEKLKEECEKTGIKGVEFIPANEYID